MGRKCPLCGWFPSRNQGSSLVPAKKKENDIIISLLAIQNIVVQPWILTLQVSLGGTKVFLTRELWGTKAARS